MFMTNSIIRQFDKIVNKGEGWMGWAQEVTDRGSDWSSC